MDVQVFRNGIGIHANANVQKDKRKQVVITERNGTVINVDADVHQIDQNVHLIRNTVRSHAVAVVIQEDHLKVVQEIKFGMKAHVHVFALKI